MPPLIHIARHTAATHNTVPPPTNPTIDPPLTKSGLRSAQKIHLPCTPDILLISPLTRTLQTAISLFPFLSSLPPFPIRVEIWPELREIGGDSSLVLSSIGRGRKELQREFPYLDFSACSETWDYYAKKEEEEEEEEISARAESVRKKLKELSKEYDNILLFTHKGFKEYLVKGKRFGLGEVRSYRFATREELEGEQGERLRWGVGCDDDGVEVKRDFGPTVLVLEGR